MKSQVESISPVKVRLSVDVPAQEVGAEEVRAFRELQRRVLLPGFRKGKAPLAALRRIYSDQVKADVVSRIVEKSYNAAVRENDLVPVSDADVDIGTPAEDGGVSFTAVVEIRPTVEPRSYRGLTLTRDVVSVDETETLARLEALRREHASLEPAPEGHVAQEGDMVVMDYEGQIDGVPFDGGKGEGQPIVLGSGMLVPGFEEGLIGVAAGDERSVEVDFPDDYRARDLAGKHAVFQVTVRELKVRRLPELDDEFAREALKVETLADLKERIRELILAERSQRAAQEFRERVIDALLVANPFEVPESLVRRQQAGALESLKQDLEKRGLDFDAIPVDKRELHESYRKGAERALRWAFLLRAIAKVESLEASEQDVEARMRAIAEADGRPYSQIRAFFQEGDRMDSLRSSIVENRVIDSVVGWSKVEEVSAGGPVPAGGV